MTDSRSIWKIWIDTGGTFTDCIAVSPSNELFSAKILSNGTLRGKIIKKISALEYKVVINWPAEVDIFAGFNFKTLDGLVTGTIASIDLGKEILKLRSEDGSGNHSEPNFEISTGEEVPLVAARVITNTPLNSRFPPMAMRLGSTRGTNALLEKKGARVGLITTKGFGDILEIGYQQRPHLFSLNVKKRKQLYAKVWEIDERLNAAGTVVHPINNSRIKEISSELDTANIESIAVATLHSYKNPIHEKAIRDYLKKFISHISPSSEVSPSIKYVLRTETAVVNAYLAPIIGSYLNSVTKVLKDSKLEVMSSSGGLVGADHFLPKDSLLSGPAGGLVGAARKAEASGIDRIITLDMGGTSTDVARYHGQFDYKYELQVGDAVLSSPALAIETIAAGGGSICTYDGYKFDVGPESAGAFPGPACYGAGGPLTITDVDLLLGKVMESNFGIPIRKQHATDRLDQLFQRLPASNYCSEHVLNGFVSIANSKMAAAIRKISIQKGYDPGDYALVAFGGAGAQHACAVADLLHIKQILVPSDASLLSAYGIGAAAVERFVEKQILRKWEEVTPWLDETIKDMESAALNQLMDEGYPRNATQIKFVHLLMRFVGQESTVEVPYQSGTDILSNFKERYIALYGHLIEHRGIELESIKVIATTKTPTKPSSVPAEKEYHPQTTESIKSYIENRWIEIPGYDWDVLKPGASIKGPSIIFNQYTSIFLEQNWDFCLDDINNARLTKQASHRMTASLPEEAKLELFTNRFVSIAEDMGAMLQRTSFSVNVKERLDFSCGLLDQNGELIANAPHIPVHLGGLGICVRKTLEYIHINEGDVIITNHPGFGGSHLPDITLISAAFDPTGELIGYVANRSHHAEIGGTHPGSTPHDARDLSEEGVIIPPCYLVHGGVAQWNKIKLLFKDGDYPTRSWAENYADLKGALASIKKGTEALKTFAAENGLDTVHHYMEELKNYTHFSLKEKLSTREQRSYQAIEYLDDGSPLAVAINWDREVITFDFTGSAKTHTHNLNATIAIVNSVVIYVLRLLVGKNIPLNEGLMKSVVLNIPIGLLNPDFNHSDANPAVVGGNTEVSQRLTDTLLKALGMAACSQGTMNNFLFGNDQFGYYETICGGTGAGPGFNGADGVHQHMTNTRITDPEILELRYPVKLEQFQIRKNSGGEGSWCGGNGVIREVTFLEELTVTLLSQHRLQRPYGLEGGQPGALGEQYIIRFNGEKEILQGIDSCKVKKGDKILIITPGGGGYGIKSSDS